MKNVTEGLEFLYRLVENFPDGILVFDLEGKVTLVNNVVLKQFDAHGSISEYLEQPVNNIIGDNKLGDKIRLCLTHGRENFQFHSFKVNDLYLNVFGKKITEGMLLFLYDTTNNIHIKNIALKNLIIGQESERQRIAKEIHDGLGPSLSTIRLGVDSLQSKTEDKDIKNRLLLISNQIAQISQEIRVISHDLMPSSLIDFGIKSALEDLTSKIDSTSNITFDNIISIDDQNSILTQSQILNLYRIVQEAIHNGIKHGNATHFKISLLNKSSKIILQITDNGQAKSTSSPEGIGIINMRARINSMNGTLSTTVLEPSGYEVKAKIPISKN